MNSTVETKTAWRSIGSRFGHIRHWQRYLFVLPLIIVLVAMTVYPIVNGLRFSLYEYYLPRGVMTFIGLKNYISALSDTLFINSFWVNVRLIVVGLFLEFTIGMVLALACNSIKRGRAIIVALLTTPVLVSISASGWAFRMLMLPEYGPLNYFIGFLTGRGWVNIDWLGSPKWAIWALIIASTWRAMPFVMLILLAGLSAINQELYEAGKIDGGNSWQLFWHITLPLLRSPMLVAFLLRMIEMIKMFDLVYLLTQGGPARTTETASFYIYNAGLRFFRVGYGSALSIILMIIIFFLTFLLLWVTRRPQEA